MIAAISLMRRRDDVTLVAFRRHWLDVHGRLVCRFPALRHYVQDHVITSPACNAADDAALDRYVASVRGILGLCGLLAYRVLQQGPAPNSTIPHLPVSVVGIAELGFGSLVELEEAVAAMDDATAQFVVEQHRLV